MKPPEIRKFHIKRGDLVVAIAGEDAASGKTGKVLKVLTGRGRAVVEGFNFVKKAVRKSQDNPQGGFVEKEAPVAISNLRRSETAPAKPAARKKPKKS
jgi:large subunit ribosomal protein L24